VSSPATRASVLLVYPPFGALSFPSLGLSLLKSALQSHGIPCDIRYLNVDFLDRLPGGPSERLRLYDTISQRNDSCVGDWLFTDTPSSDAQAFVGFLESQETDPGVARACVATRRIASRFVDEVLDEIEWERYAIVGFHSIFNQTLACLRLARALKQRHPEIVTLFGGPGAQGDLGIEIVRQFDQIDYAVRGEADRTIVPLVRTILAGGRPDDVKGAVFRCADGVAVNETEIVDEMDSLPLPDFDDYFARIAASEYAPFLEVFLPVENSRGCWWGARHHCTFCGIEDAAMAFRKKSPARVLRDIAQLVERHGVRSFRCVDNILDMGYYDTVLPRLAAEQPELRMFHEVKANVKRVHMERLARAGVTLLQPGLEHLSTEVLRLMRKGITFLQNVQFLKWAREYNLTVFWSILYGFPGERWEWYETLAERSAALVHLFPPKAAVRVRIDRFSPLFATPAALGLTNLRPTEAYHHIYPFQGETLARLAYHFEADYVDRDPGLNERISAALAGPIRTWNERYFRHGASLDVFATATRAVIHDTRNGGAPTWFVLHGAARDVYLACDSIAARADVAAAVEKAATPRQPQWHQAFTADELLLDLLLDGARARGDAVRHIGGEVRNDLDHLFDALIGHGLMVGENGRYLALACLVKSVDALLGSSTRMDNDRVNIAALRNVAFEGVEGLTVGA
jgi:ribosomal peptide maturation radical SAM protein 1